MRRKIQVAAVLVTSLLTWGCATTMSVATPTAAEELAGIKARLTEVAFSQRKLELHLAALGEARPRFTAVRFSELNNVLLSNVAALEPILVDIESDLGAFQTKYLEHPGALGVKAQVDSIRKLNSALLAGETWPSMPVTEPPVTCPGTSQWNGRGCTTTPLRSLTAPVVAAAPVLAQDAVYVQGEVRRPGAIKFTSGMTLSQAIALAGGFAPTAAPSYTYLIRGQETRRVKISPDHPVYPRVDPELRPGDIIRVSERFF